MNIDDADDTEEKKDDMEMNKNEGDGEALFRWKEFKKLQRRLNKKNCRKYDQGTGEML